MSLSQALSAIHSLGDLPTLIVQLGQRPAWEELDPGVLPLGRRLQGSAHGAAVVGRADGFEWLGIECADPSAVVQRVVNRLGARGRIAGVLGLDPASRGLAIGVTIAEQPIVELELDTPDPALLARLEGVSGLVEGGLALALRLAEALGGEDVGRRFFSSFKTVLEQMAEGLTGDVRPDQRHAVALLQLTRVLFLYFVQCKGWLDGRPDFLRASVDQCLARKRSLHRDLFRPLFFGTLNRRPESRGRAGSFGRIPFLNGGLFEPHPMERTWRGEIPNTVWRDAFDHLFEHFSFTVSENGARGAVAPDMLGRVFEGVMEPSVRRGSGTFYTPQQLVTRVVEAILEAYLASRLQSTEGEAAALLQQRSPSVRVLLKDVAVLDPAVGSGAFLLGMLERLSHVLGGHEPASKTRRAILARNLFGVDLNPMAVRLTELRLWLSIIADDPTKDPELVAPLPNLDGLIRQGDSLLDPARMLGGLPMRPQTAGRALVELRRRFVMTAGDDKRELARRLREAEARAMLECLDGATASLEAEIAECVAEGRGRDLFGARQGLDSASRTRLRTARRQRRELRRLRREVAESGMVPWFQIESHFGDVMGRGGFDIVIGNPPWVRAEHLSAPMRERLAGRYRCWAAGGKGFSHQPDLSVAFVERSLELLTDGGVLGLLLPAKLATAAYGMRLRRHLAAHATLFRLADLTATARRCFDATVYPLALIAGKQPAASAHLIGTGLDGERPSPVAQRRLLGGGPWILLPAPVHEALDLLRGEHPTLEQFYNIQLGAKTGANDIFLDPPETIEPCVIRRGIRGRDIRPFQVVSGVRLLWPHDERGKAYARLPRRAASFLAGHEALLRARADYLSGPPWMVFRTMAASAPYRVIWGDIHRRLSAVALTTSADRQWIPLNTCYVLPTHSAPEARSLAAWLNSSWLRAAARAVADPARGGFARFNARVVGSLPVPEAVRHDATLIELATLAEGRADVQKEIDDRCAELLALPATARVALAGVAGVGADYRR